MLAVEKQELTKDTNSGQGQTISSETLSLADSESFENIAEDIIKLDGKVGLLTDANARLERQRDKLLSEKVCMCFLTSFNFSTLFRPLEFSIKQHTIKSGWSNVYTEGSQVIISKNYRISFSEYRFCHSKQCIP